jgi:hypothetical protein
MPPSSYEATPPEPVASETTTIRGSSGSLLVGPRVGSNRLLFALGGLTVGLAAVAIMLVVANNHPPTPGTRVSYNDIERPLAPSASPTENSPVARPTTPSLPSAKLVVDEAPVGPPPAPSDARPARVIAAADPAQLDNRAKLSPAGLESNRPDLRASVNVPRCNADALTENALQQYHAGQLKESLVRYQAAYACKPAPALAQKAFLLACNLRDLAKARSFWKKMTPTLRTQALGSCVRNEITADMLDAP